MNIERILDRIYELYQYMDNFPDSALIKAVENEIEYLEKLLDMYS